MADGIFYAPLASELGLIQVQGPDAEKFLQGQFSNDVVGLTSGCGQWSSYSTAKGRMIANFYLIRSDERFFLILAQNLADAVCERLQKYRLMAKAQISRAENDWTLGALWGDGTRLASALQLPQLPQEHHQGGQGPLGLWVRLPWPEAAGFLLSPAAQAHAVGDALVAAGLQAATADDWRLQSIRAGTAFLDAATTEQIVPQELNLEVLGGIHFKKGCYPGQEIVARAHYLGKLKSQCYHLISDSSMGPGMGLFTASMGDQAVGMVVNAAPVEGGYEALAVLRAANAGESLHLGNAGGPLAQLGTLPYTLPLDQASA